MATDNQKAHALISYFIKKYNQEYGSNPPGLNRHALAGGFKGLVADYPGMGEKIIDYYFNAYSNHAPTKFIYDYGNIVERMLEDEADAVLRRKMRKETIERMKNVTNGSQSNKGGNN